MEKRSFLSCRLIFCGQCTKMIYIINSRHSDQEATRRGSSLMFTQRQNLTCRRSDGCDETGKVRHPLIETTWRGGAGRFVSAWEKQNRSLVVCPPAGRIYIYHMSVQCQCAASRSVPCASHTLAARTHTVHRRLSASLSIHPRPLDDRSEGQGNGGRERTLRHFASLN